MDEQGTPQPLAPTSESDDDTEGQAFKWQVVDDPKTGKRLSAGWTPDEPQEGRSARTKSSSKSKNNGSR